MAAKYRILLDINSMLSNYIYNRRNEAERKRINEYISAERLVALDNKRKRNKSAIIIQKYWRGYRFRQVYVHSLLKHFRGISLGYYDSMIIKIQKVWKGYYIRRYVFDFYKRKKYLEALIEKNEITVAHIREICQEREQETLKRARIIEQEYQSKLCRKYHYFLSTKSIPGIYNSPCMPNNNKEMLLKSATHSRSPPSKGRKQRGRRVEKILNSLKNLPNVPPKPQGPFRDPREVQFQRYKPIRQTLRMDTDFYHLENARTIMKDEEWTQRHCDYVFMPVKNSGPIYQGNVVQRFSRYIPPGRRFLRLEDPTLNIDEEGFKLVVSPIPLFDIYEEKMEELEVMKSRQNSKLNK